MLSKPIYVMAVNTAFRKADEKVEKMSKTITTGTEAGILLSEIRNQGLVNLAF